MSDNLWGVCAGGIRGAAHKIIVELVACGPAAASGAARDPGPCPAGLLLCMSAERQAEVQVLSVA